MFRDNLVYIILGLVAVVLIGVTIGLQLVLMSNQSATPSGTVVTAIPARQAVTTETDSTQTSISAQQLPTATATPTTPPPTRETPTVIPTITPLAAAQPPQAASVATPQTVAQRPPAGEQLLLNATGLTITSDEQLIANIVQGSPYAIGVMGRRLYSTDPNALRALRIQLDDGNVVGPSPAAIFNSLYPLSRVLYIYSTVSNIRDNPDVAAFMGCYLSYVNDEILTAGYLPARQETFDASLRTYNALMDAPALSASPTCTVDALSGAVNVAGSNTVTLLMKRMIERFLAQGYAGDIRMGEADSSIGLAALCGLGTEHIIHTDRPINARELADCRAAGHEPVAFAIGEDALAVVVSPQNDFIDAVTMPQLQRLFSDAFRWSDIDPTWPAEPISRVIPERTESSFSTFVSSLFEGNSGEQPASVAVVPTAVPPTQPTVAESPPGATNTPRPTVIPTDTAQPPATDTPMPPVDYVFGYVNERAECTLATQVVATLMERWGWRVSTVGVTNASELFQRTAHDGNESTWFDLTLCYEDPRDRAIFFDYASNVLLIGSGYAEITNGRRYVLAHAGLPSTLEYEDRCIFDLMKGLTFLDTKLEGSDPESWIEAHPELLEFWGSCEGHYGHSLHEHNLFKDRN